MKKLFVVLMTLALLVGVGSKALATADITASTGGSSIGTVKAYTMINTSVNYEVTNIPVGTITPGECQILGYSANLIKGGTQDGLFGIRDAISTTPMADSFIIAENEATAALPVNQIFPRGMDISRGIRVNQSGMTSVTIYYIRLIAP
jgi:hypothetical protein